MDDEKSEHHALEAFEGLLESLSGLETIHVYINRMRALPKIGPIVQHRKTLTSLSIHSQINKDSVMTYSEEDYSRICNDCSNLRQLSVMFPKTSVELPLPTSEFSAFIVCQSSLGSS